MEKSLRTLLSLLILMLSAPVVQSQCNAAFEWEQIAGTLQIHFINQSTSENPPFSNLWNFGDGHMGDGLNPTHTYDAPGTYNVCLIIEDEEGCIEDVCHMVTVAAVSDDCNAAFEWEQGAGLLVHFINQSTSDHDIISYQWNFGDGHTGDGENPTHTYEEPGIYLVCLIITDGAGCVSDVCHEVLVEAAPSGCNAAFEWEQINGTLQIHFVNQSTSENPPISYSWNFGDGTEGDGTNPIHTYFEPGVYLVCLIIEDAEGCVSDVCHEVTVAPVNNDDCEAGFEWEDNGLVVHFFNTSDDDPDIISYYWDFGDGHSSDDANPTHTYGEPGSYEVCLTIENEFGCTDEVCHLVVVEGNPDGCHAAFEWEQGAGLLVHFINQSTSDHDIISYQWNFGDGHMGDGQNPNHTYEEPGTYLVCLIITDGAGCVSDVCHEVVVEGSTEGCHAAFDWEQGTGLLVHFINQSTSDHDIISYQWNFGDGHMGDGQNPVHTYEEPGTYLVCLIITDGAGCVSDVCHEVVVEGSTEGCHAAFDWEQGAGLLVHFINQSTSDHDIISYQWNFGDGHMGDGQNPIHTYEEPGTYLVCLIITDGAGCVSDVCHEVVVEDQTEECNAGFFYEISQEGVVFFVNTSTGVTSNATWLWEFGDGETSVEENPQHDYAEPGIYTVCLFILDNETDCEDHFCLPVLYEMGSQELNWIEANNDLQTENEFSSFTGDEPVFRYTNPSSDELMIEYQLEAGSYNRIQLYDLTGFMLISKNFEYESKGTHLHHLDVRNAHPGIYIISFTIGNRRITKAVTITN